MCGRGSSFREVMRRPRVPRKACLGFCSVVEKKKRVHRKSYSFLGNSKNLAISKGYMIEAYKTLPKGFWEG